MSDSNSTQQQTSQYTDNRAVLGQDANYANNGSSISNYVLDNGAIARALDTTDKTTTAAFNFAGGAQAGAFDFGSQALSLVGKETAAALDNLQQTQQLTADAYNDAKGRGAMTDKLLIAAMVGMALVAFAAVKHGKV